RRRAGAACAVDRRRAAGHRPPLQLRPGEVRAQARAAPAPADPPPPRHTRRPPPPPPILVGGESDAALKRAAEIGDGWYGVGHTPESAAVQVRRLHELRAAAGRAAEPFDHTV